MNSGKAARIRWWHPILMDTHLTDDVAAGKCATRLVVANAFLVRVLGTLAVLLDHRNVVLKIVGKLRRLLARRLVQRQHTI